MAKAPFTGKVIRCRFTNEANTMIEVMYNRKGKNIPYYVSVDESDPKFVALLDEDWDLERIADETVEFNRTQNRAVNDIIGYYVREGKKELKADYEKLIDKQLEQRNGPTVEKTDLLSVIFDNNDDEELLFKIKLAIFELPDVKKTKNRSKKLKIRKAKTILAAVAALWDLLENEEE